MDQTGMFTLLNCGALPFGPLETGCENCECGKCTQIRAGLQPVDMDGLNTAAHTVCENLDLDVVNHTQRSSMQVDGGSGGRSIIEQLLDSTNTEDFGIPHGIQFPGFALESLGGESSTGVDVVDGKVDASTSCHDLPSISKEAPQHFTVALPPSPAPASPMHQRSFSFPVEVTSRYDPDVYAHLKNFRETVDVRRELQRQINSTHDEMVCRAHVQRNADHIQAIERRLQTDPLYLHPNVELFNQGNKEEISNQLEEIRNLNPMSWEARFVPQEEEREVDIVDSTPAIMVPDLHQPTLNTPVLLRIGAHLRTIADDHSNSIMARRLAYESRILQRLQLGSASRGTSKYLKGSILLVACWCLWKIYN